AMRGSARGYVALSGNLEQHPFVDPSMRRRSMSLRAGLRTSHSWHEAIATAMDAPDYIHYSEPFGRGVRADQRALLAGVSGGLQLNGAWRTRYRVAGSENRLSQSADDPVFADTWTTRRGRGGIDVERRVSRSRVGAFAALEHREVNTAGALTRNDDTFARTGAYWERRAGGAWILSADAAGTFAQGDGAATIGAGADWVVRTADTLRTRVRVSQRLFAEDDNLWLWSARGADLLANGGVAFSIDAPVTRTTVSSVDVGWTSTGVMGGLDVDLGLRRFDDAYVDQHTFALNPVACVFESPVNVVTGQTGHVAVVRTRLWHTLGNHSWGDFSWVYHESFNGDPALGTRWQTIPRNRLTYTIYARPSPAWGFHLRLAHISSTLWTDYAGVDGTVCDAGEGPFTVHSQLRGATTLDAGVQVTGFRHATLDVGARNLFNTPVRYHPAGALQALTVYAQFVLNWETL
ncbi:MAG TPA: hypothetical protein VFX92_05460, partial [Candidatus Krumholzibacteria bacterium]|nr:hypothetical protein [Candidatus Krumholzibacteria bacterium]